MKQMEYSATQKYEVLHCGEYKGYKFYILNLGFHPTAYVEDKLNIGSYEKADDFVDVHCGFTYYGKLKSDLSETRYLGWDYAHCGDYSGTYEFYPDIYVDCDDKKWTTEEIFEQVKSAIEQFIEKAVSIKKALILEKSMVDIVAFTSEDALSELTSLSHKELWEKGFDLDDWDIGFQCDKKIDETSLWWLENAMSSYCVGYDEVQYNGKYYYIVHHA